jgi:tetratricopeptide (TPR) repeat protein
MRLFWVLMLVTATAWAEDKTAAAKRHFRQGAAYFKQGAYEQAIDEYTQAQLLLQLPDFDFNLGQAHRMKGDLRLAVEAYKRYLLAVPDGEIADQARAYVVELSLKLDEQEKKERAEKERLAASTRAAEVQPSPSPLPEIVAPPRRAEKPPVWKRWWVWTVVGGVAAAGVAVGLGVGLTLGGPSPPSTSFGTARPF